MNFLSTRIWWIFFGLGALSYFISSFGHHGRGTRSPQLEAIGGFGAIVFVILVFIFSGWKGGIGIIVALFLWVIVAENPKLLSEYLQMKADGISDVKVASKLAESLGGT